MSAEPPEDDDAEAGGFLRNWSRRKFAARRAAARNVPAELQDPSAEFDAAEAVTGGSDAAEPVDLSDLPAVDEITETTDIRPFMRPGVPAPQRAAALRRAWSLSSHVRDYSDPAVDYAWDWNQPGGVPGGGGTLRGDSVRKMVSDVLNKEKTASRSDAAENDLEDRPAATGAKVDMVPASEPPTATALSGSAAETPAPAGSDAAMDDRSLAAAPCRHGSARPVFDDDG